MSAPRLPGTSAPVVSKSATGSSMRHSRPGRSNASQSEAGIEERASADPEGSPIDVFRFSGAVSIGRPVRSANTGFASRDGEGGQTGGEGTIAGTRGNGEEAPIPVIRSIGAQLVHST